VTPNRPSDRAAALDWTACGASVTGAQHASQGRGSDDAYGYGVGGGFVVAAVADGAGSVTGTSAWGAHIACRGVVDDAFHPNFIRAFRAGSAPDAEVLMRRLFDNALQRVRYRSTAMGVDVALLSTTLCIGIASEGHSVFGQVGDGVIAVERDGTVETILGEQKSEYANTTSFIQSENALRQSLRTAALTGTSAFALSTDGMSYKITDIATGDAYQPFFRGCWQHLRSGASVDGFESVLGGIEDDQTGDDKTMVLAVTGARRHAGTVVECSPPPAPLPHIVGRA
jgi:hypothetical protein